MKFSKTTATPPKNARILLHAGEGLNFYRATAHQGGGVAARAESDLGGWAYKVHPKFFDSFEKELLMYPDEAYSERVAVDIIFSRISVAFKLNKVLSIVTRSNSVARMTVELLVSMGLSEYLQVIWHPEALKHRQYDQHLGLSDVVRGWFQDQDTPVATAEFELATKLNIENLRKLDFHDALLALAK